MIFISFKPYNVISGRSWQLSNWCLGLVWKKRNVIWAYLCDATLGLVSGASHVAINTNQPKVHNGPYHSQLCFSACRGSRNIYTYFIIIIIIVNILFLSFSVQAVDLYTLHFTTYFINVARHECFSWIFPVSPAAHSALSYITITTRK